MKFTVTNQRNGMSSALVFALSLSGLSAAEIFRIDHDANFPSNNFAFTYAGYGAPGAGTIVVDESITFVEEILADVGVDGSVAYRLTADTTATEAALVEPNDFTYMGFGMAHEFAIAPLTSADLNRYTLTVDVAADGLLPGVTQATGIVDVRFYQVDTLLLNARFPSSIIATPDFTTNTISLGDTFETRGGSLADFEMNFAEVTRIEVVVELTNATGNFGFDEGNVMIIDNVVLEENEPPAPPTETVILTVDHDVNARSYGGIFYTFGGPSLTNLEGLPRTDTIDTDPVTNTLVQEGCVDTSEWAGNDQIVGTDFFGFGMASAGDYVGPGLPSDDLNQYRVRIDTRATGFLNNPEGKLLLSFEVPDDTLTPADDDADNDLLVRLRLSNDRGFGNGFTLTPDFQTLTFDLADAEVDAGSLELFQQFSDIFSTLNFAVEAATDAATTGFDADNCVASDNLQLIYLTPAVTVEGPPEILAFGPNDAGEFAVSFTSTPGNIYRILVNTSLEGDFEEFEVTPAATETVTNFVFQDFQPIAREFFRVEDLGPVPAAN